MQSNKTCQSTGPLTNSIPRTIWKMLAVPWLLCFLAVSGFAQAPTITNSSPSVAKMQGDNYTFYVRGENLADCTFQWYFENAPIATTSNLTLYGLNQANMGNYYAIVSNTSGSATSAVAFLTVLPSCGFSLDFNTPGQFINNFNARDAAGIYNAGVWGEAAGVGVGGSRGLDALRNASDEVTLIYHRSAFNAAQTGKVLNASVMFKYKAGITNGKVIQLGFIMATNVPNTNFFYNSTSSTNASMGAFNYVNYLSARINTTTNANPTQVQFDTKAINDFLMRTNNGLYPALVPGQWYQLSLSLTNNRGASGALSNSFLSGINLKEMGADGLTPGSLLASWAGYITNAYVITNSVYPAVIGIDQYGVDALDNLMVWRTDGPVTITYQPVSQTVLQGRTVTFSAAVDGTPPYYYQWLKGGVEIPGATQSTLVIPNVAPGDAGTYTLTVTNVVGDVNYTAVSDAATLTVTPVPLGLVSAGSFNGTKVGVRFNVGISPASAVVPSHYTVTGGGTVNAVTLRPDGQSVELTLASPTTGNFDVTVTGVQDLAGNDIGSSTISGTVLNLTPQDVTGTRGGDQLSPGYSYTANGQDIEMLAGGMDLATTADDGHLLVGPRLGDFDVRVRLASMTRKTLWNPVSGNDDMAKAGLIVRDTMNPNSRSAEIVAFPTDLGNPAGLNAIWVGYRPPGANMTNVTPNYTGYTNGVPYPQTWLRLRRANSTVSMLRGNDGISWTNVATVIDPTLPDTLLVGLGATAHLKTDAAGLAIGAQFRDYGETAIPGAAITGVTLTPATVNLKVPSSFTMTTIVSVANVPSREVQYIWQRTNSTGTGWTNIPYLSSLVSNLTTAQFTVADEADFSSWAWRCIVKVPGALAVTSGVCLVTGYTDTNPPYIGSVSFPNANTNCILVSLSKMVNAASAVDLSNWHLTNSVGQDIPISSISLIGNDANGATLMVVAGIALTNSSYGLVINGVTDIAMPPNPMINAYATFSVTANNLNPGTVLLEQYWVLASASYGFDQNAIAALTNNPKFYISNAWDNLTYTANMAVGTINTAASNPADFNSLGHDDDGNRLTSYFIAPATGNFVFYTRSDDGSVLLMNTNAANSTDPAGKTTVAALPTWVGAVNTTYGTQPGMTTPSIAMTAGQRYYMELLNKNGGGGDGVWMAMRLAGDPTVPPYTEALGEPYLELPIGPVAVASLTPSGVTVTEGQYTTFSASGISGAVPYYPRWYRNGVLVPTASGAYTARVGPFTCGDTNVTFVVSNLYSLARISVPVTITPDVTPPTIMSATADGSLRTVYLKFSEGVNATTAANPANYSIPGLNITSASMSGSDTVVLKTGQQNEGQTYTLNISNVKDASCGGNVIEPVSVPFTAWVVSPGLVWREFYMNIGSGNCINADLLPNAKVRNHTPDLVDLSSTAQTPDNYADGYGAIMYGYFLPPVSGSYTFFVQFDDGAQILLSTDESKENARQIWISDCAWDQNAGWTTANSGTVSLQGQKRYYFEARMKEGGGGDRLKIAVRTPLDAANYIPNTVMGGGLIAVAGDPNSPSTPQLGITQQPVNSPDTIENTYATFSVKATNSAGWPMGYTWQKYDSASSSWVNLTGGSSNLSLLVTCNDDGAQVRVKVTVPGRVVYSTTASVHVLPDTVPPGIAAVLGDPQSNKLMVVFNEKVSSATANIAANYTFSGGPTVTSALLLSDQQSVALSLDADVPAGSYTVTVQNVADLACSPNPMPATTSAPFQTPWPTASGYVQVQLWNNLMTDNLNVDFTLTNLTSNVNYPMQPDLTLYTNSVTWPQTDPSVDNYGMRMTGIIIPPTNGNYYFKIWADDSVRMTISPYGNVSAGTRIINAEGSSGCLGCGGITSLPYNMVAGFPYTFEVLFLEGTGGDYVTNLWQVPGTTYFTNVPAENLAFTVNPDIVNLVTTRQPTNMTILEGRPATFVAVGSASVGIPAYQWQYLDATNTGAWVDLPGENGPVYRAGYRCEGDNSLQVRAIIGLSLVNGLITRTNITDVATLTVLPDEEPPYIVSVGSLDGNSIGVVFNEPVRVNDPEHTEIRQYDYWQIIDTNIAGWLTTNYYTGLPGCDPNQDPDCYLTQFDYPVTEVVAWPDPTALYSDKLVLKLGGHFTPSVQGPFSVTCYSSVDTACRANENYSTAEGMTMGLNGVSISFTNNQLGSYFVANSNRVMVTAAGYDTWNNGDELYYVTKPVSGDFDARVTVIGLPDPAGPLPSDSGGWSKAGLMFRGYIEGTDGLVTNNTFGTATNSYMAYMAATSTNTVAQGIVGANVFAGGIRYSNLASATDLGSGTRQSITGLYPTNAFPVQLRLVREGSNVTGFYWGYVTNFTTNVDLTVSTNLTQAWVSTGPSASNLNWNADGWIGLGTTAHSQPSGTNQVTASYQDFYLVDGPTITLQPVGLTNLGGSTAIFSVAATGPVEGNPMRYTWFRNGTRVPGATGSMLTLTNVWVGDIGTYSVEVRNSAGAVMSESVPLMVLSSPVITIQPMSVQVDCFGSGTLSVVATNLHEGDTITYQWRLNGANLTGETASSITVNNLTGPTSGQYSVVVGNSYGTMTSDNAEFILVDQVNPPAMICPDTVAKECGDGTPFAGLILATNACGYDVGVICDPESAVGLPVGNSVVTCYTLNPVGQYSQCSFEVTVSDTLAPVIACPSTITTTNAVVAWPTVTAADQCAGTLTAVCTPPSGHTFPVGSNYVSCVASDSNGHNATCGFAVIVEDQGGSGPELSIVSSGTDVLVSWPAALAAGYQLQYSLTVGPASASVWQPYTGTINTVNGTNTAIMTANGNMFFLLKKP